MPGGLNITEIPDIQGNQSGADRSISTRTAPLLFTVYGGYQLVDTNNNYRLRWNFPKQVVTVRSVRISFTLLQAVYVSQSTTAGSTTGAGAAHRHNITNGSLVTVTDTSGGSYGGGIKANFREAGSTVTRGVSHAIGTSAPGESGTDWTSFDENAHTHSIPTLNLNAPSALGNGAQATGATVILFTGPQVGLPLTLLPGPYNVGAGPDFDDLDITSSAAGVKYFQVTGRPYEVQITSTSIGGIIGSIQILAELTVS